MYPLTNPRSRAKADRLADRLLRELAGAGRIQRYGHLHWEKVVQQRQLLSARKVPELAAPMSLALTTSCPAKWLSVDLETGDVWAGTQSGWRRASGSECVEAQACLKKAKAAR